MRLLTRESAAGLLALTALAICAPQVFSDAPPEWATQPDPTKVERAANDEGSPPPAQLGAALRDRAGEDRAPVAKSTATAAVGLHSSDELAAALERLDRLTDPNGPAGCVLAPRVEPRSEAPTVARTDWSTLPTETRLDRLCERTSLRGVVLRAGTETRTELRLANLDGRLVTVGQELEPGLVVSAIGSSYVELREGTRTRRVVKPARNSITEHTGGVR